MEFTLSLLLILLFETLKTHGLPFGDTSLLADVNTKTRKKNDGEKTKNTEGDRSGSESTVECASMCKETEEMLNGKHNQLKGPATLSFGSPFQQMIAKFLKTKGSGKAFEKMKMKTLSQALADIQSKLSYRMRDYPKNAAHQMRTRSWGINGMRDYPKNAARQMRTHSWGINSKNQSKKSEKWWVEKVEKKLMRLQRNHRLKDFSHEQFLRWMKSKAN